MRTRRHINQPREPHLLSSTRFSISYHVTRCPRRRHRSLGPALLALAWPLSTAIIAVTLLMTPALLALAWSLSTAIVAVTLLMTPAAFALARFCGDVSQALPVLAWYLAPALFAFARRFTPALLAVTRFCGDVSQALSVLAWRWRTTPALAWPGGADIAQTLVSMTRGRAAAFLAVARFCGDVSQALSVLAWWRLGPAVVALTRHCGTWRPGDGCHAKATRTRKENERL